VKRIVLFVVIPVAVLIAAGSFWFFGINQESEENTEATSPPNVGGEVAETLTTDEAIELAEKLVNQDEATYAAAWSHENIPSVSPEGTTIVVNAVESGDSVAVVDVTITTPETEPEEYYLLTQFVNDQWRIYTMEAK
jgi:flagellar basal body-associated protein FliL